MLDRYLWAALALGLLLAPAAFAGSAAQLAPVLFAAGLAFGPANVALFESLDVLAPGSGTEALTWITTAEAGGSAAGSALAGVLVTRVGVSAPVRSRRRADGAHGRSCPRHAPVEALTSPRG